MASASNVTGVVTPAGTIHSSRNKCDVAAFPASRGMVSPGQSACWFARTWVYYPCWLAFVPAEGGTAVPICRDAEIIPP